MINIKQTRIPMKKIVRLTESELKGIMRKSVVRALQQMNESINNDREIRLAQKALSKFPISEVGMRLEGTQFNGQFKKIREAIIDLNDALIKYIRKE